MVGRYSLKHSAVFVARAAMAEGAPRGAAMHANHLELLDKRCTFALRFTHAPALPSRLTSWWAQSSRKWGCAA